MPDETITVVKSMLRTEAGFMRGFYEKRSTMPFLSLAELVLTYGMGFTSARRPSFVRQMRQHACYDNAYRLVDRHADLAYVEGYFAGRSVPTHHAWCVTRTGEVVDPTLNYEPDQTVYFGIPLEEMFYRSELVRNRMYCILVPNDIINEKFFDGTYQPERFIHPWFRDQLLPEIKERLKNPIQPIRLPS